MRPQTDAAKEKGRMARDRGVHPDTKPYLRRDLQAAWRDGWHQRDNEIWSNFNSCRRTCQARQDNHAEGTAAP